MKPFDLDRIWPRRPGASLDLIRQYLQTGLNQQNIRRQERLTTVLVRILKGSQGLRLVPRLWPRKLRWAGPPRVLFPILGWLGLFSNKGRVISEEPAGSMSPTASPIMRCAKRLDAAACWLLRHGGDRLPVLPRAHDELILRRSMRKGLGYRPNLKEPQTYNEKVGWRILNDPNPLIKLTTDKLAARDYVARKVGTDVLIPIIGVYEQAADIPWAELPSQFVLKATHGCEMTLIVYDKDAVDQSAAIRKAAGWLKQDYYELSRERAYRDIPRRLVIEKLLLDDQGRVPPDYKILVFHGRAALIRVHNDRFGDHRVNYYDREFVPIPVRQVSLTSLSFQPPSGAEIVIDLAERLAEDFDYARIDLYFTRGKAWFGEITHHDGNAHVPFHPSDFDAALGALWHLPYTSNARRTRQHSLKRGWTRRGDGMTMPRAADQEFREVRCRGDGFGNLLRQRLDALNSQRRTNAIIDHPDGGSTLKVSPAKM